jgi:hypothetical protein
MKTVLVCGGRDFDDLALLKYVLEHEYINTLETFDPNIQRRRKQIEFITGGGKGADFLTRVWLKWFWNMQIPDGMYKEYPAEWDKYGAAAGPIRNKQMLDEGLPDKVIAFPGGSGTADMVKQAKERGIEVVEANRNTYGRHL